MTHAELWVKIRIKMKIALDLGHLVRSGFFCFSLRYQRKQLRRDYAKSCQDGEYISMMIFLEVLP